MTVPALFTLTRTLTHPHIFAHAHRYVKVWEAGQPPDSASSFGVTGVGRVEVPEARLGEVLGRSLDPPSSPPSLPVLQGKVATRAPGGKAGTESQH